MHPTERSSRPQKDVPQNRQTAFLPHKSLLSSEEQTLQLKKDKDTVQFSFFQLIFTADRNTQIYHQYSLYHADGLYEKEAAKAASIYMNFAIQLSPTGH